jgi:hypothetical protein
VFTLPTTKGRGSIDEPFSSIGQPVDRRFGGIAAPQDAVAAIETDDDTKRDIAETAIRVIYAPVIDGASGARPRR